MVRRTIRWGAALVGLVLVGGVLTPAPVAAGRAPQQDSVSGSGTSDFFGDVDISATSGAQGEAARGTMSAAGGALRFDGLVTCLRVSGPVATFNLHTFQLGVLTVVVRDGATDEVTVARIDRALDDCSPLAPGTPSTTDPLLAGGLTVVDATTGRPPGPRYDFYNRPVSGPLTGTSVFRFGNGCSFVHEAADLTVTTDTGGTGSLHYEGCIENGSSAYSGTFRLTTPGGSTLSGTLAGVANRDIRLTVTASSGFLFRNVRGPISVSVRRTGNQAGQPLPTTGMAVGALRRR